MSEKENFNTNLVFDYPKSNRKIDLEIGSYSLPYDKDHREDENKTTTTFISPHGMEFLTSNQYNEGELLKINVNLPEFWDIKKQYVEYNHTKIPLSFKILAKVVESKKIGKRNKKCLTLVQTVNIDEIDCKVLEKYLEEQK